MNGLRKPAYSYAELGILLGIIFGGILGVLLLALTGQTIFIVSAALCVWIGYEAGYRLDLRKNHLK